MKIYDLHLTIKRVEKNSMEFKSIIVHQAKINNSSKIVFT